MSECVQSVPPAAPRDRSIEARRAARRLRAEREKLVVEYLNSGISVPEIAAACGVTEKHMRAFIRETLARRMPAPPAEFLAMQVSRLNEALLVSYSAMSGANLQAVDRVVKIVRELDRYHGFVAAERRFPDASRLDAPALGSPALAAPLTARLQMATQTFEKIESAAVDGTAEEASDPEDATPRPREAFALGLAPQVPVAPEAPLTGGLEMAPQTVEKTESAPESGMGPEASGPQDVGAKLGGEFASAVAAAAQAPLALETPLTGGLQMAPQMPEKVESAPEDGMAPDASGPQDVAAMLGEEFASVLAAQDRLAPEAPLTGGLEMAPQALEKSESAPEDGMAAEGSDRQDLGVILGTDERPSLRASGSFAGLSRPDVGRSPSG